MKKYIDAELQIVRMNSKDIVCASGILDSEHSTTIQGGADRFRDFEDYSY